MGLQRLLLLFVHLGHVVADDAAADRAGDGVVTGVMAGDAADQRALEAAFGLGLASRPGGEAKRQDGGRGE